MTAGYVFGLDVNPVTNKVYVANAYIGKVTVIDGATDRVTTINVGHFPTSLAVNPVTHTVYVANSDPCGGITVIDGKTEEVNQIKAGIGLDAVAVNAATNQIYAYDPETLTIIDGATKETTSLLLPIPPGMPRYTSSSTCRWSTPVYGLKGAGVERIWFRTRARAEPGAIKRAMLTRPLD